MIARPAAEIHRIFGRARIGIGNAIAIVARRSATFTSRVSHITRVSIGNARIASAEANRIRCRSAVTVNNP
jgi:hypothetical protein